MVTSIEPLYFSLMAVYEPEIVSKHSARGQHSGLGLVDSILSYHTEVEDAGFRHILSSIFTVQTIYYLLQQYLYLSRGRKRIQLLDDLADGKDYASLKREAEDRSIWRVIQ